MATRGGARVLGRDDVGMLAPGMTADVAAFDMRGIEHAGALRDPVAALVFCAPRRASHLLVNGKFVLRDAA